MSYLLDSNTWIALLRWQNAGVLAQLKRHPANEILLCSVLLAELWYGALLITAADGSFSRSCRTATPVGQRIAAVSRRRPRAKLRAVVDERMRTNELPADKAFSELRAKPVIETFPC